MPIPTRRPTGFLIPALGAVVVLGAATTSAVSQPPAGTLPSRPSGPARPPLVVPQPQIPPRVPPLSPALPQPQPQPQPRPGTLPNPGANPNSPTGVNATNGGQNFPRVTLPPTARVQPSINSFPGYPAWAFDRPAAYAPSVLDTLANSPWLNRVTVTPVPVNRFPLHPWFNDPFVVNPLLRNGLVLNPLGVPGYIPPTGTVLPPWGWGPVATQFTPPTAEREPGYFVYRGPDLQVNPWTGTEYRPVSGLVRTASGENFYRVPGTGLPTDRGTYASGTGLYYNPQGGTFFSPRTGLLLRPGHTQVFLPYVW